MSSSSSKRKSHDWNGQLWHWSCRRQVAPRQWQSCLEKDLFHARLYSHFETVKSQHTAETADHGGIFNFDFSTDGSMLAAACERKSVLLFDPLSSKLIHMKRNAHQDCVNCIRFLDNRMFATCSDDTTVRLWDSRFMSSSINVLRGHSNWVKNIEYSRRDGLLVTSGFDGSIYTWDINSYNTEGHPRFKRVFHSHGLMRSKLTPDSSKLVIATCDGYLMVIHDLDLAFLPRDLLGFKPNMYYLMLLSQEMMMRGTTFKHLFYAKRNRVELILDFPEKNDAEMISSLQVHPQGWCSLTRNISSDEDSEWTCVHDIQSTRPLRSKRDFQFDATGTPLSASDSLHVILDSNRNRGDSFHSDEESSDSTDSSSGSSSCDNRDEDERIDDETNSDSDETASETSEVATPSRASRPMPRTYKPRLLYFSEEPNVGRGYIKEPCFSSDGRLVISPFGFGVRMLAFNPQCQELCDCDPKPTRLGVNMYEVKSNMSHTNVVTATKYSPTHSLFVSGCLDGKVSFHSPVL